MIISERHTRIVAEYLSGMTLNEVGVKHGITGERVRQIVAKYRRRTMQPDLIGGIEVRRRFAKRQAEIARIRAQRVE